MIHIRLKGFIKLFLANQALQSSVKRETNKIRDKLNKLIVRMQARRLKSYRKTKIIKTVRKKEYLLKILNDFKKVNKVGTEKVNRVKKNKTN